MPGEAEQFIFRPIQEGDKINRFDIDPVNEALRSFLKRLALKFHSRDIAKTYVAIEEEDASNRVRSYISILNSEIRKEYANIEDCPEAGKYDYAAIKIARLATDRKFEGRGLATGLIELVSGIAKTQVMPYVGCRFLMLDANREKIDFYKRRGFSLVSSEENMDPERTKNPVMFIDLYKVGKV